VTWLRKALLVDHPCLLELDRFLEAELVIKEPVDSVSQPRVVRRLAARLLLVRTRWARGRQALSLLLTREDLPGQFHYRQVINRTYPVDSGHRVTPEAARARRSGGLTAARAFRSRSKVSTLVVQIWTTRLATVEDALAVSSRPLNSFPRNPLVLRKTVDPHFVDGLKVASATEATGYEESNVEPSGRTLVTKFLRILVESTVVVISCTSDDNSWTWDTVTALAELQAQKLRVST
jgi:hypothetical protein